jgi:hypothetical protein
MKHETNYLSISILMLRICGVFTSTTPIRLHGDVLKHCDKLKTFLSYSFNMSRCLYLNTGFSVSLFLLWTIKNLI